MVSVSKSEKECSAFFVNKKVYILADTGRMLVHCYFVLLITVWHCTDMLFDGEITPDRLLANSKKYGILAARLSEMKQP